MKIPTRIHPALVRLSLAVIALLVLDAADVFARAGGGGGYSGGSSGGGGGYGGGGGGEGEILFLLIRLAIHYPAVGVPALVIFAVISLRGGHSVSDQHVSRTIVRAGRAVQGVRCGKGTAAIKARDTAFDLKVFERRVRMAFVKIQEAWCAQNMGKARAFISDGIMQRFTIQFAMQKAEGIRNAMTDIKVLECAAISVQSESQFDIIHLRIRASAVDTYVSLEDGKKIRGSGRAEEFVEIWSFLRRPGAKTSGKAGLIEGFCPSCGAPIAIADSARCGSCQSWVNSGQYDWVLTEITQACEWTLREASRTIPGFAALLKKDQALNSQFIEDRASVAFWRWQVAMWKSDPASLKSVATSQYCSDFGKNKEQHQFYWNAAVGSVDLLAVETGGDMDKAHVMVKWSGKHFVVEGGEAVYKDQVLRQHVLVFVRKKDNRTDPGAGLRSMRCAGCGAPATESAAAECEFCGASFTDGSRHWVLADVFPGGVWSLPDQPVSEQASLPGGSAAVGLPKDINPVDALAAMSWAMMADGRLDSKELAYLDSFSRKNSLPKAKVEEVIAAVRSGQMRVEPPKDPSQGRAILDELIRVCLADGQVSQGELLFLAAYGRRLSITPEKIRILVDRERAALYEKSKGVLASS